MTARMNEENQALLAHLLDKSSANGVIQTPAGIVPELRFSLENRLRILLTEYEAIERMHSHYDILNMSLMAVVTAGVFTIWGLVTQAAFQSNNPIENPSFVNDISILALVVFFVLSIWIRYMTIHRCIVIHKLNRSHEIERKLGMEQNLIFVTMRRNSLRLLTRVFH